MEEQYPEIQPSVSENQPKPSYRIHYSPASQLGILVGMAFIGMVVGGFVALIPALVKGVATGNMGASLSNISTPNMVRWIQIVSTVFTFLFPIWVFQKIVKPQKDFLHVRTLSAPKTWLFVVLLAFASMPVTELMADLNHIIPIPSQWAIYFQKLEDNYDSQILKMMQMKGMGDLLISLFIVALLPAVLEEAFFRGGLQSILVQWFKKPFWAILVTSVIFSAIHFSYYGFLPRAFLGMALGYIYYWSKDLKLNMLVHFINNAVSVITIYVLIRKNELTTAKMNESMSWYWQVLGLGVFVLIGFILKKQFNTGRVVNEE